MEQLPPILLLLTYLAFASNKFGAWLKRRIHRRRTDRAIMLLGALLIPYALANRDTLPARPGIFFEGLFIMAAYVYIPGTLAIYRQRVTKPKPRPFDLADLLIILIIWLPIEFGRLPAADATLAGTTIPIVPLTGVVLLLLIFFVLRPLSSVGFNFALNRRDLQRALKAFAVFAVVGIPVGFIIGFLKWDPPHTLAVDKLVIQIVGTYLLIALPEELLFRGVIQNLLEKRFAKEKYAALIIAAITFGAAHLNSAPAPNYPYMLMASGAGVAYGWVWMRTRKVTASALTHTLVGIVWGLLLGG